MLPDILNKEIGSLKGIGTARAKLLGRLGIKNIFDLLYYLPRSYLDRSQITKINQIGNSADEITIMGEIKATQKIRTRYGKTIGKVAFADETGIAYGVWFQYPKTIDNFKQGDKVLFSGKISQKTFEQWRRIELMHPTFEIIGEGSMINSGRIVPIYGLTEGISQKFLRNLIFNTLQSYVEGVTDFLPSSILEKYKLSERKTALINIHFPSDWENRNGAYRRLAFEELFLFYFKLLSERENKKRLISNPFKSKPAIINKFLSKLPFQLTASQIKVWSEIEADLENSEPMNRLLQGDVGSGKTIIALLTLLKGIANGYQGALMAPTEILAEQHFLYVKKMLADINIEPILITGSLSKKEKEANLNAAATGEASLIVGTHALIQKDVQFKKLGVVVIDEQHRFGVEQRKQLEEKGEYPHLLVMTATPIPRSLAFTFYGDLDYSAITELPPGRKKIVTRWRKEESRCKIYEFLEKEIIAARQVFVVCPLITESEILQVEAAEIMYDKLKKHFPRFNVGLIHGQLPTSQRDKIMEDFRNNNIHIIVATTVIEVGVDIPNASVMLVEDAQRFGLAQLHQLRGRVGRGNLQSYCILLSNASDEIAQKRLLAMEKTNDGFQLAEEDLKIRGAGEFFGKQQHGYTSFKVTDLNRDLNIILTARQAVKDYFALPGRSEEVHELISKEVEWRFPGEVII